MNVIPDHSFSFFPRFFSFYVVTIQNVDWYQYESLCAVNIYIYIGDVNNSPIVKLIYIYIKRET
jgi:hypothetical protein